MESEEVFEDLENFDINEEQDEEIPEKVLKRRGSGEEEEFLVEWSDGFQTWEPFETLESEDVLNLIKEFEKGRKDYQELKKKENEQKLKLIANDESQSSPQHNRQRFPKVKKKVPVIYKPQGFFGYNYVRRPATKITHIDSLSPPIRDSTPQHEQLHEILTLINHSLSKYPQYSQEALDTDKPILKKSMLELPSNLLEGQSDIARLTTLCVRVIANFLMQIPKKQAQFIPTKFKGSILYYMNKKGLLQEDAKVKVSRLLGEQSLIDFSLLRKLPNEAFQEINKCKNLTILKLAGCQLLEDETFHNICRKCPHITYIDISSCIKVNSLTAIKEGRVPKLVTLIISELQLESIWELFYAIIVCEKLLHVKANHVSATGVSKVKFHPIIRCNDLEYLDVSGTLRNFASDFKEFFSQAKFTKLKTLIVADKKEVSEGSDILLKVLPNVENLQTTIHNRVPNILDFSPNMKKLSLRVFYERFFTKTITSSNLDHITRNPNHLVHLELIEMQGVNVLEILHSGYLSNLRYLNLHNYSSIPLRECTIQEFFARFYSLFTPTKHTKLSHLVLSCCSWVSDLFLSHFLPTVPNLEYLNLSSTPIADVATEVIRTLPKLAILHISKTSLSAKAITQMASESLELKWLHLPLFPFQQVEEIVSKCPRLQVLQLCQYVANTSLVERLRVIGKTSNISKVIIVRCSVTPPVPEVNIITLPSYVLEDDFPDMQFIF